MKKDKIWTDTTRRFLYTKLIEKFGPYKEWELKTAPKKRIKFMKNFVKIWL